MDGYSRLGQFSPEHIVSEHRVALGLMKRVDGSGIEHGVILGLFEGPGDDAILVAMRLLTSEQAEELADYLVDTANRARTYNAAGSGTEAKEGK